MRSGRLVASTDDAVSAAIGGAGHQVIEFGDEVIGQKRGIVKNPEQRQRGQDE
jgi:hypothetical protein